MRAAATLEPFNLAAILASLALVIAPHAQHLPVWIPAFATVALLLRFYLAIRHKTLPARGLLFTLAVACVIGVAFSYRTLYGRDVGVALLAVMAALKVLEMSKERDTVVVMLLAYFLVVTNFFYSQSIPTAIYLVLTIWVITATMLVLQCKASRPRLSVIMRDAGTFILQGIPLMLVLFVLFPRVQGPLWGLPQINYTARTGLSETMSPGDVSSLGMSDAVAFRVLFDIAPERPSQLYWRGPVMWNFDGRTWGPGPNLTARAAVFEPLSASIAYNVTLEPHEKRWLFAIDLPTTIPQEATITTDYQMFSRKPVRDRLRYRMESVLNYRAGTDESSSQLRHALRLPPQISPRARALAASWRTESKTDRDIVDRALAMFRELPFAYTLEPPILDKDPVDQFLFETRSGFCEHYASSFTFLMRAAGVPARVVTGYLGGEVNPVDGYLVVRQSEAHAWSEVWLEGSGWVRVDPTAAVSPLRFERGLAAAVPASDRLPLLARPQFDWLRQVRFAWDAVTNSWNQWVLGYNPERQMKFLSQLGFADVSWQNMVIALMTLAGTVLGVIAAFILLRYRRIRPDPVQRLYLAYCRAMARRGAIRSPHEGPRDYAARISLQFPDLKDKARAIGDLYIALRYRAEKDPTKLETFRLAVRDLP
jgi:protein-glutamine gamma-glutamyltransferase